MSFKEILHHLKFRYNVVFINEDTLTEKVNFHLSWLTLIIVTGLLILVSFILISCLILLTPLKHYLPGVADIGVREEVIQQAAQIDSLSNLVEHNERQLYYIKCVIAGEVPVDSMDFEKIFAESSDTTVTFNSNAIDLSPTAREKDFLEKYSQPEKEE